MSEYPSLKDLLMFPLYLLMLLFGGAFAYFCLVLMFVWRELIKKPVRKLKNRKEE